MKKVEGRKQEEEGRRKKEKSKRPMLSPYLAASLIIYVQSSAECMHSPF
jgi:hypothetical protein